MRSFAAFLIVALATAAVLVAAATVGDDTAPTRVRTYVGLLHPAGLADGPLRVPFTARGVWFGEGRVAARVRVWLEAGGRTTTTVVRVPLRAGWG